MTTLALHFLGPPRFVRDDAPVTLTRAKGVALLLYLAVTRVPQPRDQVLDLLWPQSLAQSARKNMRNTLWAIGETLGNAVIEQDGANIRLVSSVQVDIPALEDALLLLPSSSVTALEAAVERYSGPLAAGLVLHEAPDFEIWLTTERERLASVYLRLLEQIIVLRRDAGDWQAVIDHASRALAADPLRESMHLALIEAYIRLGQRAQAVQHYAALVALLRHELDVAPLPEITARYESLLAAPSPVVHLLARSTHAPEPPTPFVGRRSDLAALDAERARAAAGTARVVLISGDLGIGKSQLWRTWVATRTPEAVLLTTHTLQTDEPVPFGPLLTLFRRANPAHDLLASLSSLAPIWLTELARLLPEITTLWPDLPPPLLLSHAEERGRLLQALTEAMRTLAQPLLLLVIDDLHWADPSTLDWLVYLMDHLRDAPLLLIGTYRPQDSPERLNTVVAGWQRQGQLRTLALPHLTEAESYALLDALGAAHDTNSAKNWVHQSGGNPYFLLELQRMAPDEPPCDLATLVRARVQATVPAFAVSTLQAAAVLGDDQAIATLQATSGRNEEDTLDALDALRSAAVLEIGAGSYYFIHPLIATIVRQGLSPTRQAFLHRRAAEALERITSQPEEVASQLVEHFAAAGELERAAEYAQQAASQALMVGAFVEATTYARRALQWQPTPQRHLLLGEALMISGGARDAQAQLEAALRGFEQTDNVVGAMEASSMLAQMAIGVSEPDLARDWLARAPLERAALDYPLLTARAYLLAAGVDRQSQRYNDATAQLAHADQVIQAHSLPMLAAQIAFERGNLFANCGDLPAALLAFESAIQFAQTHANPVAEAMASNNLAYHHLLDGDLDAAQRTIHTAIVLTDRYALRFMQQYVQSTAGEIALAQGDIGAAETALAHAYDAAQEYDNRTHMANVRINQAQVAQARNDFPAARTLATEAQTLLGDAAEPFVRDKIARISAAL